MGLLSFFKRLPFKRTPEPAKPAKAAKAAQIVPPESPDSIQQARLRARQRLIGSVVLVVAGVIGFSLLFETQPRPLPVDTPIEIARRDGSTPAPSVPSAPARSGNKPATGGSTGGASNTAETQADAGREVASAPAASAVGAPVTPAVPAPPKPEAKPAESKPVAKPDLKPEPKPEPKPELKPEVKPTPKPADGARAQALLEGKDSAKKPAAAEGRFIVQVGAFADQAAAREARQKVEKLGLKTYTQVVETSGGNRIRVRVGPFNTRDEADKAAGKIKSAGLPSAVYTL